MAFRTWGRVLLAALCIGMLAGAGQLGIAYGLGILRFARTFEAGIANHWSAQLGWLSWFAMSAAVAGAVAADRLAGRREYRSGPGPRIAIAVVASLGGATVAPLGMLPARAALVASTDPVLVTGLAAGLGAIVGIFAALAALSQRWVRWNIAVVIGAVWFLALVSLLPSLGPTDPLPAVRLGVLDPAWLGTGAAQRLAVVTMPGLALIAGAAVGALARWREQPLPVVAGCGVAGPAMLSLAYLIAGPGGAVDRYQAAPYWGALIATGTGALGSILAATVRWPAAEVESADPDPARIPAPPTSSPRSEPAPTITSAPVTADFRSEAAGAENPLPVPAQAVPSESQASVTGPEQTGPEQTGPQDAGSQEAAADPEPADPKQADVEPADPKQADVEPADPERAGAKNIDREQTGSPAANGPERVDTGRVRRSLFRRSRSSGATDRQSPIEPAAATDGAHRQREPRGRDRGQDAPIPAREAEYVDWVSGLSAPTPRTDEATPAPDPRRSLRSSGRHHSD